jgi:hypothetical protein
MTTAKRPKWRVAAKVLAAALSVSVPVLALAVLGGNALAPLSGRAAPWGEFRVLDTVPAARAGAVKPAPADEPIDVELTNWEHTLRSSNSL